MQPISEENNIENGENSDEEEGEKIDDSNRNLLYNNNL